MPSFVSVPAVHSILGVFLFILAKIYVVIKSLIMI